MVSFRIKVFCLLFWTGDIDYRFVLNINWEISPQQNNTVLTYQYKAKFDHLLQSCIICNLLSLFISWNVLLWHKQWRKYKHILVFSLVSDRPRFENKILICKLNIQSFVYNHWYLISDSQIILLFITLQRSMLQNNVLSNF